MTRRVIGIPFSIRRALPIGPGTRFGPQGSRRISALLHAPTLRARRRPALSDDLVATPATCSRSREMLEKSFDADIPWRRPRCGFSAGGVAADAWRDHSIGFPAMRGNAQCHGQTLRHHSISTATSIIHDKDLDERMHTTPWYWQRTFQLAAISVQLLAIGGWQVPRYGVAEAPSAATNVLTDRGYRRKLGLEKTARLRWIFAGRTATRSTSRFDVDSVDCGFVPQPGAGRTRRILAAPRRSSLRPGGGAGVCGTIEVVEGIASLLIRPTSQRCSGSRGWSRWLGSALSRTQTRRSTRRPDRPTGFPIEVTVCTPRQPPDHESGGSAGQPTSARICP